MTETTAGDQVKCPVCGNTRVYGLLKDANGNYMCINCYKDIYGHQNFNGYNTTSTITNVMQSEIKDVVDDKQ